MSSAGYAKRVANGTKSKMKCLMSALFSHAVRWEFTSMNPISSGVQVGGAGSEALASAFESARSEGRLQQFLLQSK